MTKEVFYRKVGRRYVPVREYDSNFVDSMSKGTHLVMCYPGGRSIRYNIDPDYAAMIAAGRAAEDAISRAIMRAQEMRPRHGDALTEEQHLAWERFVDVMGERGKYIEMPSAREAAEAGVNAMIDEAKSLLDSNPSVLEAYENLITLIALSKKVD
jgi:hypothetical protein